MEFYLNLIGRERSRSEDKQKDSRRESKEKEDKSEVKGEEGEKATDMDTMTKEATSASDKEPGETN